MHSQGAHRALAGSCLCWDTQNHRDKPDMLASPRSERNCQADKAGMIWLPDRSSGLADRVDTWCLLLSRQRCLFGKECRPWRR